MTLRKWGLLALLLLLTYAFGFMVAAVAYRDPLPALKAECVEVDSLTIPYWGLLRRSHNGPTVF